MGENTNKANRPSIITIGNILGNNMRTVLAVVSFIGALYVQNEINKVQIVEIKKTIKLLDDKQDEAYRKLDELKLDKAVFNATMQQMQLIQSDMRETRSDVKNILQIVGDRRR